MNKLISYLRVGLSTTINVLLYTWTLGRFIWLEGRVSGGVFRNWMRLFRYRPLHFAEPESEAEIIALIRNSTRLRVFGAGHSFNDGIVGETLVSLDRYRGVLWVDLENRQMAVKGGTRIREVTRALANHGLALEAQPSHDAQSIGGILSTDVHGTGRSWGFVSESVVSLKLIDGRGLVLECFQGDDLFRAAVGGAGAAGIISEVVIQAVDRFHVEQKVTLSNLAYVESNLDRLLLENDHFSIYAFPYTDKCQINTWLHTEAAESPYGEMRELVSISLDALLSTWIGNFLAYSGLLKGLSDKVHSIKKGSDLVLESSQAFTRTIYPLHQELEFAVPYEQTFTVLRAFLSLYERLAPLGLPYGVIEVRFTPAGYNGSWIGAGRERMSAWIDVIYYDSHGVDAYYDLVEALMMALGGRPHLGKWNKRINSRYLAYVHGPHFEKFRQVVTEHDPQRKFVNDYTRRLFDLQPAAGASAD
jgi:L-gulono-1,4-lactone dehydrogenase